MKSIKKIAKTTGIVLAVILVTFSFLMLLPRIWSALNPAKPPVGYHFVGPTYLALMIGLEDMINKEPDIPEEIEEIKDIEYKNVDGKSLQMDFYRPKGLSEAAPLLVFIHGGGWKGGKRSDYLVYLVEFAKRGYITATVSYRLLKDKSYPASAEDIIDAFDWLALHGDSLGYDPERIGVVGGSAGAHLAMLAAYGWQKSDAADTTHTPRAPGIRAVVNIYGPVDMTTEYARNHSLVTNYLAHSFEEAPQIYWEASPLRYVDRNDPPTLILHGTSDDLVPVSQADLLKARLDSLGVPCVYHRMPLWPHTMDLVQRVNDYFQVEMSEFFEEYVR